MKVKLVVIRGKPAGKTVEFPAGEYYFGRGKECHVRSNNEWISRQHCLLRVTSTGAAYLRDLGSRNGTLVNGVLLSEELLLQTGDQVQLGPLVFEVRLAGTPAARRGDTPVASTDATKTESPDATAGTDAARISTETYPAFQQPESGPKKS